MVLKHALRNALIPIITLGAIEFGRLLSGAVLTEQVFAIPGFGKLLVDGVFNRDYAVVQAVVLVSAGLYVLLNLGADVLYFLANPRLRGSDVSATPVVLAAPAVAVRRRYKAARQLARRPAAMIALAVVLGFVAGRARGAAARAVRPDRDRLPRGAEGPLRRRTCSAPTRSAATCCRACSGARAPRCWPASSR